MHVIDPDCRHLKQVILRSPYIGNTRLTRARYQQMIGRAGNNHVDK